MYLCVTIQGAEDCCSLTYSWTPHKHNTLSFQSKEHQRAHPDGCERISHSMVHLSPPVMSTSSPGLDHIYLIKLKDCPWLLHFVLHCIYCIFRQLHPKCQKANTQTMTVCKHLHIFCSFFNFLLSYYKLPASYILLGPRF